MKNYIIVAIFIVGALFMWSCDLNYEPLNSITDEQITELLESGDADNIDLVLGSMANGMAPLFNASGQNGAGSADARYYTCQGLDYMRCLEGNDIVLGEQGYYSNLGASDEYTFGDFISQSVDKNAMYWLHYWALITDANQLLFYLDDETVGDNATMKMYKAWGLVIRGYCYASLMENYQDAYLQGGSSKLGLMLYDTYNPDQEYKARSSSTETYEFIVDDLETAVEYLEEYYSSTGESGYTSDLTDIDLGVAQFVLARVKLEIGEWDDVIELCDNILDNYTEFISEEYYGGANKGFEIRPEENAFLYNDVNPEAILGFPNGTAITALFSWTNPFGGGYGGYYGGYSRIDDQLFDLIDDNDYRQDCFLDTMIVDYVYATNSDGTNNIPAYSNLKFAATYGIGSDDKSQVGSCECNYMRMSEVLLMKAEAYAQNSNESAAKNALNELLAARTRSGATTLTCDTYSGMSGMSALEMVQLQWRIEMWGEGGREYFNNKRWNIAVDRTGSSVHYDNSTYSVSNMTCDIPDDEMLYNPLCEQN